MKIVLCNGCFDLFHYGHLLHLEAASRMGDLLAVSVTSDASVYKQKGRGHPVYTAMQRAAIIKALSFVDDVVIAENTIDAMRQIGPDILVKGIDYRDGISAEDKAYCLERGIEIRFTNTLKLSAQEMMDEAQRRG